jgi:hypothetical protein
MSINDSVSEEPRTSLGNEVRDVNAGAGSRQAEIKKIDVAALRIDDADFVDRDPYNSTGQFVTDAIQEKFRD